MSTGSIQNFHFGGKVHQLFDIQATFLMIFVRFLEVFLIIDYLDQLRNKNTWRTMLVTGKVIRYSESIMRVVRRRHLLCSFT